VRPLRPTRLLLAPMLATAAAGVSFWLNVPKEHRVGTPDVSVTKEKARRVGNKPDVETRRPRDPAALDRLWNRYAHVGLEDEPVEDAWARAHRDVLHRVIVAARQTVFAGAPEPPQVVLGSKQCRKVRCRFSLCGPMPHEVRLLNTAVRSLLVEDASLWRHYAPAVTAPGDAMSPDDFCLQITVAFASDDPDLSQLRIRGRRRGADGDGESQR